MTDENRTAAHDTTNPWRILRPSGTIDAFTVVDFRYALTMAASPEGVLIDLSGVSFIDSAGLGALIAGIRRIWDLGGGVVVVCSRPALLRVFHTTGFDRLVPLTDTIENARRILAGLGRENRHAEELS